MDKHTFLRALVRLNYFLRHCGAVKFTKHSFNEAISDIKMGFPFCLERCCMRVDIINLLQYVYHSRRPVLVQLWTFARMWYINAPLKYV